MTRQHGFFSKRPAPLHGVAAPPASTALLASLALLCALSPRAADAGEATAWAKSAHSEARLIDGGAAPTGTLLAGLEMRLDPAFITYWRDPGDAGVPPVFDVAGSTNLRSADVRYPAPEKLDEAGATAFGYEREVTFPILVEPADPSKPVGLYVRVSYAVCHDICLPARATLRLDLDRVPSADAGRVGDALAAVPRRVAVGDGAGPLAILAIRPDAAGGFGVEAKGPRGTALFVEAPDAWSYEAGAGVEAGAGRLTFPVKRVDGPRDAAPPPVTLTLVAPTRAVAFEGAAPAGASPPSAIEVHAHLDAAPRAP